MCVRGREEARAYGEEVDDDRHDGHPWSAAHEEHLLVGVVIGVLPPSARENTKQHTVRS